MMKITRIALAATALLAISAQAQAQVRMSGASATSNNYIAALDGLCSGTITGKKDNAATTLALGNRFTLKCSVNFDSIGDGTGDDLGTDEVQIDVSGGSLNAVKFSTSAIGLDIDTAGRFVSSAATCSGVGSGTIGGVAFTGGCAVTPGQSVGGYMDVEPSIFLALGALKNSYSADATVFSQVFGVAVSNDLYTALQQDQGLTGACAGDTTLACQPSISRAEIASLMNNDDFNDAKVLGLKFLAPSKSVAKITYCKRPITSGTQASAQLYFLSNPSATSTLGGKLEVIGDTKSLTNYQVSTGSGSSNVISCLNAAGYSFGILSGENNPYGTTASYKYVKVNGAGFAEGTLAGKQKAAAVKGKYDFLYEAFLFNPTGDAVLNAVNAKLDVANNTGLFTNILGTTPESRFTRNGNNNSPIVHANP